ncbi:MmpS family transport accessory protein [Mycobacterium sp.]|uniref:MmpS family transport accessory protein n=1 Tax=Mycobacterium sp. TaxID=1785 RepID=UPI003C77170F
MTSQPSRIRRRVLNSALTALVISVSVCGVANATGPLPQVTYQLSGTAPVADYISFQTPTGQTQQPNVPLPWTTKFTSFGYGEYLVSAQSPGSVTCTILVDGKVVSQATANGGPARTVCWH